MVFAVIKTLKRDALLNSSLGFLQERRRLADEQKIIRILAGYIFPSGVIH
jgi:hypothetical protein